MLTSDVRHEHLYEKTEHKMIRTDSLPETRLEAQRMLLGARVILCTSATLLNERLANIAAVAPVETLIMDEASQIEIGDYVPVINRYQHYLRKMVFIGDHKQREYFTF
jgi:superfamily I DNA and/or RNA helicase